MYLGGASAKPSHLATIGNDVPCTSKETMVITKTILNIHLACGTPAAKGKIAKIIGTAPLKPTHETYNLSLSLIFLKGVKVRNTTIGRPKNIRNIDTINAGTITPTNSLGFTNKPRVKNNNI